MEGFGGKRTQVTIWPWNQNFPKFSRVWHAYRACIILA